VTNENLAEITRAAHDWGLASWLGGSMFGQFALNPAVSQISDRRERGKVVNAAWNGYNAINAISLGAVAAGWAAARLTESAPPRLTERERSLAKAKDALTATALISGFASGVQGGRLAKSAPEGAVPVERGLKPASDTPPEAARAQKSLRVFGSLSILSGVGLVIVNALMAQLAHSRPPLRRGLLRRSA
jgi:hypothetical protein